MTADERRNQLIDSAINLFGQRGFSGTTTKSLALAAGVSEATIFKHFPTKVDLYAAAFERRTGVETPQFVRQLEALADSGDDQELLRRIIAAVFLGFERDRDLHRLLLFVRLEQDATENARLASHLRKYSLHKFLRRYVARRQKEGVFAPGPVAILADAVISVARGVATETKLYGVAADHADEALAETLARFVLAGLRKGPVGRSARGPSSPW